MSDAASLGLTLPVPANGTEEIGRDGITYVVVGGAWLAKYGISGENITDNSVSTVDIADGSITLAKLAADVVALLNSISGYLRLDGANQMLAALNFGGFRGTNIADGTDATDAVSKGQMDTALSARIPRSIVDAKGDLIVGTGIDTVSRLPVGTDGYVMTADSSKPEGVTWTPPGTITVIDGGSA